MVKESTPTILIVDADAASRNYLAAVLRQSHYTVLRASSGREGLVTAWQNLPDAIIVDPDLPDMKGVELVVRLRQDRRTANAPCIALCGRESHEEMTKLLSSGYNDYLAKSTQAVSKLLGIISRLLQRETAKKEGGVLVVFLSAKGGTGTSSLCANIAMCLGKSQPDVKVMVMDLVLPIGSIAHIVGYIEPLNLVSVAALPPEQTTPSYFQENLPRLPEWHFRLLAGSPDPEDANRLPVGRIAEIVVAVREGFDYIFIDLGRSLSRISLPIIQAADVIALVLSTDLSTITLTQTVWEYLRNQGVEVQRVYPILNRAVGLEGLTKTEADRMLGLEIRVAMPYMGGNFTLANNRHEPVATKFPDDSVTLMLQQASEQMAQMGRRLRDQNILVGRVP